MSNVLMQLFLFSSKAIIVVVVIFVLLIGIIGIASKGKEKLKGRVSIKNLNKKYQDVQEDLLAEILSKENYKKYLKTQKATEKARKRLADTETQKNIYVLNFNGDIKASAVSALREEISAVLGVAKKEDEVVVRLESGGGMVHAYGLAAAQLARLRAQKIPLTITVDKVAASGGYLMACVANKILAAPFSIIGSIGVIVQMPNFNKLLHEKNIQFEQLTAGDYKRTLTMFGHNTEEGREKLQEEIEDIHDLFKQSILAFRPTIDIDKVATGEHWLGTQALQLKLVDEIKTSDDYLLDNFRLANIYEITYESKKSFASKFTAAANALFNKEDYSSVLLK
jgi:serine protease SohB